MLPALIRFVPRPGKRVNAREASYIIGVLDVAGYEVRAVLPDDSIDFQVALDTMRITRRNTLLHRESDPTPPHEHAFYVRVDDVSERPAISVRVAPGSGTPEDPFDHNGDSIATSRAILRTGGVPDKETVASA